MSHHTALLLSFARRGEDDAMRLAVSALREAAPKASVVAVGTPVSAPVLRRLGADEVVVFGDGQGVRTVLRGIRERRPGAAAVVYWEPGFAAHLKLEALALLSRAPAIYRVAPEAPVRRVGRARLARSVLGKSLAAAGCLLAGVLLCSLAFLCLRLRQSLVGGSREGRA